MESLLYALALLACPIGMGIAMWLVMRRNRSGMRMPLGLCLDWKVLVGLGVVGLGIWVVAPNLLWVALPVLLLTACPLSMLLMARGMQGGHCAAHLKYHLLTTPLLTAEQVAAYNRLRGYAQEPAAPQHQPTQHGDYGR